MNSARAYLLAGAVLAFSAACAAASPALVVSDLNLRAGPGVNYRSVGVIPGGSTVNVHDCGRGWCTVSAFGRNGFVNDNYLDFGAPLPRRYAPPPPPVVYGPPVYGPSMYGPPVYLPPPPPYYRPYYRRYYW